jgi:ribosomal protein S20
VNNLYSIFDKAVKKGIVHKNTAARKKSKVGQIFTRHNITLLENDTSLKV